MENQELNKPSDKSANHENRPLVSLEDMNKFATFSNSQGSKNTDLSSLGFPTLAVNVDDLIDRCRTQGADAGACIKAVKRHTA